MHKIRDEQPPTSKNVYESVQCPLCARYHLINVASGKALGEK